MMCRNTKICLFYGCCNIIRKIVRYSTRFDTVLLKIPVDKVTQMAQLPDEYGLVIEKIKVQEGAYKWVKKRTSKEELRTNTSNCIAVCFVEIPAEYKTIQKLVLKASAHQRRYDNFDSIIFKQTIETKVSVKTVIQIPPQYEQVFKKLNPNASYSAWKEFLSCDDCVMNQVREIQEALKKRGYDVGESDNIMGAKTKAACIRFQKDNNLETGNLNIATLRALELFKDED
jgi:Putative peptidoglycan binding domain